MNTTTESSPPANKHNKIVLVDDDRHVLELIAKFLGRLGYDVDQASSSSAALDTIKALDHVDLLLTDVIIPGDLNGHQLAQKTAQYQPDMKVLYMSGLMENSVYENASMVPGVNMLRKPFRQSELAEMLDVLLH